MLLVLHLLWVQQNMPGLNSHGQTEQYQGLLAILNELSPLIPSLHRFCDEEQLAPLW